MNSYLLTLDSYQKAALRTAVGAPPIIYPALGLASEAGEVAGKIKKVLRDSDGDFFTNRMHREGLKAELGDVLWYVAVLAADLDLSLGEIAQANINKLADRAERGVIGGSGDNR